MIYLSVGSEDDYRPSGKEITFGPSSVSRYDGIDENPF